MRSNKHLLFLTDGIVPSRRAGALHVQNILPELQYKFKKVSLLSQGNGSEKLGVDHFKVIIPCYKGKLILLLFKFRKMIQEIKPDLIYSRFVLLPLINRQIPYVIELHDDAWNKGLLFRLAFRYATQAKSNLGFVAITEKIQTDFELTYPNCKKLVEVIPDAAHHAPGTYLPKFSEKRTLNIAYVGSFHKGKGIEVILPLAKEMPMHNFILLGELNETIVESVEAGNYKNLILKGFVAQKDLWKEMAEIDICLLPNQLNVYTGKKSNIGRYTSPLKMFEYMAYSKPIIASDLEVLREVLDEDTAVFAIHDNIQSWVKAINTLMNVNKREALGQKAHKRFIENYTWEKRAERILAFVNKQLEKK